MIVIRSMDNGKHHEQSGGLNIPFPNELSILIGPQELDPTGKAIYKLKDCRYWARDSEHAVVELIIKEIREASFAKWFRRQSDTTQHLVGGLPVILIIVLSLSAVLIYQSHPDYTPLWAFAGRHLRMVGGWGLFIFLAFVIPLQFRLYGGIPSFAKVFFPLLFMMTGIFLAAAWLRIAALPSSFTGSEREYAAYAQALVSKLSTSYWPIVVAGLPWLAIGFKTLGLDLAEKDDRSAREIIEV